PYTAVCVFSSLTLCPPTSTLFPYTTLFRSFVVLQCLVMSLDAQVCRPAWGSRACGEYIESHARQWSGCHPYQTPSAGNFLNTWTDRKSTRLNSSHVKISYAVFCLKKKKKST